MCEHLAVSKVQFHQFPIEGAAGFTPGDYIGDRAFVTEKMFSFPPQGRSCCLVSSGVPRFPPTLGKA